MKDDNRVKLFLVDDDALFLKAMEIDFKGHPEFAIETFPSGESCIENLSGNPDIIVLDYHLDGLNKKAINGMQTLDRIRDRYPNFPVIMLSSQDKIEVAIDCMHHGAIDYVVKSETAFIRLIKIIHSIFRFQKIERELKWYMERM